MRRDGHAGKAVCGAQRPTSPPSSARQEGILTASFYRRPLSLGCRSTVDGRRQEAGGCGFGDGPAGRGRRGAQEPRGPPAGTPGRRPPGRPVLAEGLREGRVAAVRGRSGTPTQKRTRTSRRLGSYGWAGMEGRGLGGGRVLGRTGRGQMPGRAAVGHGLAGSRTRVGGVGAGAFRTLAGRAGGQVRRASEKSAAVAGLSFDEWLRRRCAGLSVCLPRSTRSATRALRAPVPRDSAPLPDPAPGDPRPRPPSHCRH